MNLGWRAYTRSFKPHSYASCSVTLLDVLPEVQLARARDGMDYEGEGAVMDAAAYRLSCGLISEAVSSSEGGCCIVYVHKRDTADDLASRLRR